MCQETTTHRGHLLMGGAVNARAVLRDHDSATGSVSTMHPLEQLVQAEWRDIPPEHVLLGAGRRVPADLPH